MYKVVGNLWNNVEFEIISDGNRYFINEFEYFDEYINFSKNVKFTVFKKDGKLYRLYKANNFNTQIYDIIMQELVEIN